MGLYPARSWKTLVLVFSTIMNLLFKQLHQWIRILVSTFQKIRKNVIAFSRLTMNIHCYFLLYWKDKGPLILVQRRGWFGISDNYYESPLLKNNGNALLLGPGITSWKHCNFHFIVFEIIRCNYLSFFQQVIYCFLIHIRKRTW